MSDDAFEAHSDAGSARSDAEDLIWIYLQDLAVYENCPPADTAEAEILELRDGSNIPGGFPSIAYLANQMDNLPNDFDANMVIGINKMLQAAQQQNNGNYIGCSILADQAETAFQAALNKANDWKTWAIQINQDVEEVMETFYEAEEACY